MFYAHSENTLGNSHELRKHLYDTAERAQSFALNEGLRPLFRLVGLLHDLGKFQDGFQKYLIEGRPRTPHAGIGATISSVFRKHLLPLQFVIQGHHSGLPDNQKRKEAIDEYSADQKLINDLIDRFEDAFPNVLKGQGLAGDILPKDLLSAECLTRFLFSALTDADWLDTESHFSPERSEARVAKTLDHDMLIKCMEKEFDRLQSNGPINSIRTKARKEAMTCADSFTGFFSLQLPTGLGKTLISVYWALRHAKRHSLKRVVIVLPYLNIIDQTAALLKGIFGEEAVLEHHSGIVEESENYRQEGTEKNLESSRRLACENWDAPMIVTTSVQFFESLFGNKPFKCRKNHNIADSVVVFDEIQTLPKHFAEPTVVMLKNIAQLARTSFLFCTATLPAFAKREGFDGIESIQPLIGKPEKYFKETRRVNYKLLGKLDPISMDDLAQTLSVEKKSFLAILNTKKAAQDLYARVCELNQFAQRYHLSTAMCPHHRKRILGEINKRLEARDPIAVVSTQLVEAGVDLDFPCVYRAIAPMDAIIQSAGRCNRNGTMKKGKVILFNLENQGWPDQVYRTCANWTMAKIKDKPSRLHRSETFEKYYEEVTKLFVNPDRFDINEDRRGFNFQTVADKYRIIDKPTVALIIARYSPESTSLLNELKESMDRPGSAGRTRLLLRQIQQYSVQVYRPFLEKHNIEPYNNTLHIWYGDYDPNIGLSPENIETVF